MSPPHAQQSWFIKKLYGVCFNFEIARLPPQNKNPVKHFTEPLESSTKEL